MHDILLKWWHEYSLRRKALCYLGITLIKYCMKYSIFISNFMWNFVYIIYLYYTYFWGTNFERIFSRSIVFTLSVTMLKNICQGFYISSKESLKGRHLYLFFVSPWTTRRVYIYIILSYYLVLLKLKVIGIIRNLDLLLFVVYSR